MTLLGQFNNITLDKYPAETNGYRMDLGTGNNLRFVTKLGSAGWGVLITGGTTFVKNKWYHVAVTRNGSSFDLWVDGTKDATTVTNSDAVLDATVSTMQMVVIITLELRLVHYQLMVTAENLMDIYQTYTL